MSFPLPDDQYTITNYKYEVNAARNFIEDRSLNPKKVVVRTDSDIISQTWEVKSTGAGTYRLKIGGAFTGELDGFVYAFFMEPGVEWTITQHAESKAFSIANGNLTGTPPKVWVLQNGEEGTQVSLAPPIDDDEGGDLWVFASPVNND